MGAVLSHYLGHLPFMDLPPAEAPSPSQQHPFPILPTKFCGEEELEVRTAHPAPPPSTTAHFAGSHFAYMQCPYLHMLQATQAYTHCSPYIDQALSVRHNAIRLPPPREKFPTPPPTLTCPVPSGPGNAPLAPLHTAPLPCPTSHACGGSHNILPASMPAFCLPLPPHPPKLAPTV